jgi:hypothetical protein
LPPSTRKRPGERLPSPAPKVRRYVHSESPEPIFLNSKKSFTADVFVEKESPPDFGRGGGRGKPATKLPAEPLLGPFTLSNKTTWGEFISELAAILDCRLNNLVVSSLQWRFIKPKTAVHLPVTNEAGFLSMCTQVSNKPVSQGNQILVRVTRAEHASVSATTATGSFGGLHYQGSTGFDEVS